MRDTKYAKELATASLAVGNDGSELRLERLHIKSAGRDEVRWSWWKKGKITPRPLDLTEAQLLELFQLGMAEAVFTTDFLVGLRNRIDANLAAK